MNVKLAKGGTLFYYELCQAMWKVRSEDRVGKSRVVQTRGGWRVTGIVEDSEEEGDF